MRDEPHIPIADCKRRHVYRLHSRNLKFGVFAPEKENGFIGIRTKFKSRFLFTEHHWDNGPPHGTARPVEDLGPLDDKKVRLWDSMPTTCGYCGERLEFAQPEGGIVKDGKSFPGEWRHISGDRSCSDARPEGHRNSILFQALERIEFQHKPDEQRK